MTVTELIVVTWLDLNVPYILINTEVDYSKVGAGRRHTGDERFSIFVNLAPKQGKFSAVEFHLPNMQKRRYAHNWAGRQLR